jgi:hypothetical protein
MTNFEEIKRKIANMNIDELMEFCGGDRRIEEAGGQSR